MTKAKEETIENYSVKYQKYAFSKNIKITLRENNSILVTMPYFCPYKTARDFLMKNFVKLKGFKINSKKLTPDIKTKFETLILVEDEILKTKIKKNIVYFHYPKNIDFNSDLIQKSLKDAYFKALKIEAKNYLIQRLQFLAQKYGFKYNKVTLRNQKTRFGSCSFKNDISLNINLMKYDFDLIDYVLIHELCHTKIKNHSNLFWSEVEKYCPDWKLKRKRLKQDY